MMSDRFRFRSKEDDVAKISTSIFITNFPDSFSAKDLFQSCKQYGHVVDAFIPTKRSKSGKKFGFVRFINVFNDERLVNNLCTIWNDRLKFHANIARFHRNSVNTKTHSPKSQFAGKRDNSFGEFYHQGSKGVNNSYVQALKGQPQSGIPPKVPPLCESSSHVMVLDDSCLVSNDLDNFVMGEASHLSDDESVRGEAENVIESNKLNSVEDERDNEVVSDTFFGDNEDEKECTNDDSVGQPSIAKEVSADPFNITIFLINVTRMQVPKDQHLQDADVIRSQSQSEGCNSHIFEGVLNSNINCSPKDCVNRNSRREGGSILEVLDEMIKDPNTFHKDHHIISDNFIALCGTWIPMKSYLLMISVYAPQSSASKRLLWNYISSLINSWNGESMVMGDFNEVRSLEERWGYSFTWVHPLASKISKLDRFLMTDGVLSLSPHLSSICLDKHLSDHHPILLRELVSDYGPIPFRIYHSWFSLDGFDKMVTSTWNSFNLEDGNGMIRFKNKIQMLKNVIHLWVADFKKNQSARTCELKVKLSDIDKFLDQRNVSDDILFSRMDTLKQLQEVKKRANLFVKGIMVEGEWVDDPNRIKYEFRAHFANRFQDPGVCHGKINFCFPNHLNFDQVSNLESPVSYDEIRDAVWACGGNKSPGPDGYTFEFFRKFWDVVGPDLCIVVKWFFEHGSFASGCNSSFVTIIPKILDPKVVNDYRPISLIGSIFLKLTTPFDGINWMMFSIPLVSGSSGVLGFGAAWFRGDPLAPFLFILIMESLHVSFSRAIDAGIFTGIKLDSSLTISNLFYADDAVFIGEWSNDNLRGILNILKCFSLLSGLSINLNKSHLLGVGVPDNLVTTTALCFGCSVMKYPFKYFGVRVGDNMSLVKAWDEKVTKLRNRLSKWKLNMSLFKVLKSILNTMEGIHRDFFNGIQEGHRKISWTKWSKVLAAKKYGGLGVYSFFALNRALISKWVWRYLSKDGSLWCRVISSIHGAHNQITSVSHPSLWGFIIKEMHSLKVCDLNGDGDFRVKDIRSKIDDFFLPKGDVPTRWIKLSSLTEWIPSGVIQQRKYPQPVSSTEVVLVLNYQRRMEVRIQLWNKSREGPSVTMTIMSAEDTLEAKYMADDASSKKFLVSNFTNYKMTDSRPVLEQYNELLGILRRFTQHKINMDESIKDNDKPKSNNVVGPLVVNMVEHNNSSMYNDNKGKRKHHNTRANPNKKPKVTCWKYGIHGHLKKDCKAGNVGNRANGSNIKGSKDGSSNPLKGQNRCWFKIYESLNDGSILHMGNKSTALVYGRGCVDLRLDHVYFKRMQNMSKDGLISTIDMDTEKCKTCMLTKITKKPFQNIKRESKVLELIHSDLCDLHASPSLGNKKYFVTFIDDASRVPNKKNKITPYELWTKRKPNLNYLGPWGCRAAVRLPDPKLKTLGEKGIECIFVGYAEHFKAFRFYVVVSINSIIESRDAIFDENMFSSVPRPSQRSMVKRTKDSGGSVVSERVTDEIV
nr:RNA-directed DNA polymerase, eukaryota [Tanacetum cinerariifolium]